MNTFFNILFVLSVIGALIGCSAGDAADGCCGCPGTDWMNDEAQEIDRKIAAWVGGPSIAILLFILLTHQYFGITLFGCF